MKIAICYSGSTRTFEYCVKNHASLIPNADVYISTWSDPQRVDKVAPPWYEYLDIKVPDKITYDYLEKCIPSNFKLKKIVISDYFDCPPEFQYRPELYFQYYKIKEAYNLIEEDYDIIVRCRMDITISHFPEQFSNNLMFDPYVWADEKILDRKINEMIWLGTPDVMLKSVKIFDNLPKIQTITDQNTYFGESICYNNLLLEGLFDNIQFFEFGYKVWR